MPSQWSPPQSAPPCVAFEDDHLLVVRKPAGWNTHAPAPYAGEGLYDWLRAREPRWSRLAIIHRLDKETSGLIVFGKSVLANQSLTQQFTERSVCKDYVLWSHKRPSHESITVRSTLMRRGSFYESVPHFGTAPLAETQFNIIANDRYWTVRASPKTGRTHQIRVHAAAEGFPVLGDELYGGEPWFRMCLHAHRLEFDHPTTGERVIFTWPADFLSRPQVDRRSSIIVPAETDSFRTVHGAADDSLGWFVDRVGDWEIAQSEVADPAISTPRPTYAEMAGAHLAPVGRYFKTLSRHVGATQPAQLQPSLAWGSAAPVPFYIRENGVRYQLSLQEGYSAGLFLDQRDNRRRLLKRHVCSGFPLDFKGEAQSTLLNAFAYTCGFSVCGALAGFKVTSLDLSRKYLDWGRQNFSANSLESSYHDWIFGDVFDWFKRLSKKGRQFDLLILDPPTFSRSKESGTFNVETGYAKLVQLAVPLIKPGGVLFASTNAARLDPEWFCSTVRSAAQESGRHVANEYYAPQPPDFPITPESPGYLKTYWLRLDFVPSTVEPPLPVEPEIFD